MSNQPDREITVIEGMWQIGKTSLLKDFAANNYQTLVEPLHVEGMEKTDDLDWWYVTQHLVNLQKAIGIKRPVAVERSIASTVAFMRSLDPTSPAVISKIDEIIHVSKATGLPCRVGEVVLMEVNEQAYFDRRAPNITDVRVASLLTGQRDQFVDYQRYLKEYIDIMFPHATIAVASVYTEHGFQTFDAINSSVNRQVKGTV